MVGRLYHLGKRAARASGRRELLERFDLDEAGDRLVKTYSGGMRRRLDLAAALVARPPVLFLDEPTTGLDPRSRLGLWEVIEARVAQGSTVLLTTQYLDEADRLADRIAVIDHGTLIAEGTLRRAQGAGRRRADRGPARAHPSSAQEAIAALTELASRHAVHRRRRRPRPRPRAGRGAIAEAVRKLDAAGIEHRRHRGPPADARRRLPHPHRPPARARGGRRGRGRATGEHEEAAAMTAALRDLRHAGAGAPGAAADPAQPGAADRLHGPADHVHAAVRRRLRRRDPDPGLRRLRRLPDPGDHRPADGVRRLRDRARPRRRPEEGPRRPLPLAADVADGGAHRPHALGHRDERARARGDDRRRLHRRLLASRPRRPRCSAGSRSAC